MVKYCQQEHVWLLNRANKSKSANVQSKDLILNQNIEIIKDIKI